MNQILESERTRPAPEAPGAAEQRPDILHLLGLFRSSGGELLEHLALHSRLARMEWVIEKRRLVAMAATVLTGTAALVCMMASVGVLALAISWDTGYRIATILALIAGYAIVIGLARQYLMALSAQGTQSFAATRAELQADLAVLKGHP